MTSENEQAVVYIADSTDIAGTDRCLDHCKHYQYDVVGIVAADWDAAAAMLRNGTAGVVVVDSRTDLPTDATPRCEVVAEQVRPSRNQHERRTRIIRRDAAT